MAKEDRTKQQEKQRSLLQRWLVPVPGKQEQVTKEDKTNGTATSLTHASPRCFSPRLSLGRDASASPPQAAPEAVMKAPSPAKASALGCVKPAMQLAGHNKADDDECKAAELPHDEERQHVGGGKGKGEPEAASETATKKQSRARAGE